VQPGALAACHLGDGGEGVDHPGSGRARGCHHCQRFEAERSPLRHRPRQRRRAATSCANGSARACPSARADRSGSRRVRGRRGAGRRRRSAGLHISAGGPRPFEVTSVAASGPVHRAWRGGNGGGKASSRGRGKPTARYLLSDVAVVTATVPPGRRRYRRGPRRRSSSRSVRQVSRMKFGSAVSESRAWAQSSQSVAPHRESDHAAET
jgi:hypothetical protein